MDTDEGRKGTVADGVSEFEHQRIEEKISGLYLTPSRRCPIISCNHKWDKPDGRVGGKNI